MSHTIVGVMGPGNGATQKEVNNAYKLGKLIGEQGWVLLTGGRNVGVMDAASKGAKDADGLVVGVLPSENKNDMSNSVDIPICTGMGSTRNNINILSSNVVIACGTGAGTTAEIMLALKKDKSLILLNPSINLSHFIKELNYPLPPSVVQPEKAITIIKGMI